MKFLKGISSLSVANLIFIHKLFSSTTKHMEQGNKRMNFINETYLFELC